MYIVVRSVSIDDLVQRGFLSRKHRQGWYTVYSEARSLSSPGFWLTAARDDLDLHFPIPLFE